MTEISAEGQHEPVTAPEDVLHTYLGTDSIGDVPKIGVEIEQTLYRADDLSLVPSKDSVSMVARGEQDCTPLHHEPSASSLETVTDPFTPDNLPALLAQIDARFDYMRTLAGEYGYTLSPFGHLPHVMAADHEIVNKERYQVFWNPPREDMRGAADFFIHCMNIQTSVSYKTPDDLLRMVRLSVALEPLIFLSTDSNAGFYESTPAPYSIPLHMNTLKGRNGGIPDFYYTARTGDDFIKAHVNFVLNNDHIFAYWNNDNQLVKLPSGAWTSFSELNTYGGNLTNHLNYRQAQSESWRRAVNIAPITRDESMALFNHRAEFASFQTGLMHQRYTAPLLTYLMAFDTAFQDQTARLLRRFGIDIDNLAESKTVLDGNFKAAVYHENRFAEVPFGAGTLGELARGMADIVEACLSGTGLEKHAVPVLHIWRTGRPDWLVYRECFPTLEDAKNYLTRFPSCAADKPELFSAAYCADIVFQKSGCCSKKVA